MTDEHTNDTRGELSLGDLLDALDLDTGAELERAVRQAHKLGREFVPHLIQFIEAATELVSSDDLPDGKAHFIALFLLTELRAKEALPAIVKALSLPDSLPFELFGDAMTELLPSILTALADDRLDLIDSLIEDTSLDEHLRWGAATTYVYFVRDGLISRAAAVARLRQHLIRTIANRDEGNAAGLVLALDSLAAAEALEEIKQVIRLDLLPPRLISLDWIEKDIAQGEAHMQAEFESCRPTGIDDAIEALREWHIFDELDAEVDTRIDQLPDNEFELEDDWDEGDLDPPFDPDALVFQPREQLDSPQTIRNTQPHVGRNSPCPCGSGKKFKKCCGAR